MKECVYFEECPSATGWCLNRQPGADCIDFINENARTHELLAERARKLAEEIKKEVINED